MLPLAAAVAVVLLLITAMVYSSRTRSNLPPGPKGIPIIGHLHLLGRLPHISLQQLAAKFGPLMYLRLGSVPLVVVSSPAMAKEILKTHDTAFAFRPRNNTAYILMNDYRSMSFSPYGDYWKMLRKLCATELFTTKRVSTFTHIIREELQELCSDLRIASKAGRAVPVRDHLRAQSFNVMTRILMKKTYYGSKASGDPRIVEQARSFVSVINETLELGAAFSMTDYFPYLSWLDWNVSRCKAAAARVDGFLQEVLDEQRDGDVPDFVEITSSYIGDVPDKSLKLKSLLLDLLLGGSETSSTTSEWALAELLHHPYWMNRAQQEIETVVGRDRMVEESDLSKLEVVNAIIKETFRLHPPVALLVPHSCTEPQTVAGYDIPKNSTVMVNVYAIGRDPTVWSNPLEFNPERFIGSNVGLHGQDFELLPFGSGKRSCPGLPLGLKSLQLVLSNLLHGFDWRFPDAAKQQPMSEAMGIVNFMAHALEAIVVPRLDEGVYKSLKSSSI